ncbi:hypothetical protein IQ250_07485 [Pseudanabaenaceae cyanobacterium LEGE 13415]|nr:hypothetical protein [Pseudanabaenaceae cyanobacterium LEGE 13415]
MLDNPLKSYYSLLTTDRSMPPMRSRSSPALWFFLVIKQSGFVWGQLLIGAA